MNTDDFTLSAVPLRGPLAPIAALLGDGDGVLLDTGNDDGWWGRIGTPPGRLDSVDLVTSPAARSATVMWLEEQGYTAAHRSDEALLIALRHVCGLPPAPPPVDCDTDDIPF